MSDHLIAEANRHTKALPKMTLPTTKPNDLDLLWYKHECERLQVRNEVLECENAALRAERVLVSVHTGKFTTISGRAMICPDCGRALLHEDRAVIDAARMEAQP